VKRPILLAVPLLAAAALTACGPTSQVHKASPPATSAASQAPLPSPAPPSKDKVGADVYAAAAAGDLAPQTRTAKSLVYVADSSGHGYDIIDQKTMKLVSHRTTSSDSAGPQHVVPGWDLTTLYATDSAAGTLTPIDPRSGANGTALPVADAYDLSFTPDGRYAVVIAKDKQELDFRDPHSFALLKTLKMKCPGPESIDYTADDQYAVLSCEFGGKLIRIDLSTLSVAGTLNIGGMPEQVRLDPLGQLFYVADLSAGGVHEIDAATFEQVGFLPTGRGTHDIIVSRDSHSLYVTNRTSGTVSVVDVVSRQITATWKVGGSPDLGGLSANGSVLWLADTYGNTVYALSTAGSTAGAVLAKIPVGKRPLGLTVWPQPGRYALGGTGTLR
jgi:YVTN family beta-propeller protein